MNATPVLAQVVGSPIVEPSAPLDVSVEADRSRNCCEAPCTIACPTSIGIPRFIRRIATGDLAGSARTIMTANPLGASPVDQCISTLCQSVHTWREQLSTLL